MDVRNPPRGESRIPNEISNTAEIFKKIISITMELDGENQDKAIATLQNISNGLNEKEKDEVRFLLEYYLVILKKITTLFRQG